MSTPERTESLAEKVARARRERIGKQSLDDVSHWVRQREIDAAADRLADLAAAGLAVVELPEPDGVETGPLGTSRAKFGTVSASIHPGGPWGLFYGDEGWDDDELIEATAGGLLAGLAWVRRVRQGGEPQ